MSAPVRRTAVRSAANAAGATSAIQGAAKPSNHMLPPNSTTPTRATTNASAPKRPGGPGLAQVHRDEGDREHGERHRVAGVDDDRERVGRERHGSAAAEQAAQVGEHDERAGDDRERARPPGEDEVLHHDTRAVVVGTSGAHVASTGAGRSQDLRSTTTRTTATASHTTM